MSIYLEEECNESGRGGGTGGWRRGIIRSVDKGFFRRTKINLWGFDGVFRNLLTLLCGWLLSFNGSYD